MGMSDKLTELLRERFNDHQVDVPPGTWEHVSGQLASAASGESLRESLQDKFRGHEVKVAPSAWANITGQLGHVVNTGISLATGWLAAGVGAVVMTTALLIWNAEGNSAQVEIPAKPQVVVAEVTPAKPSEAIAAAAIPEAPKTAQVQEPLPVRAKSTVSIPVTVQQATQPVQTSVPQLEKGNEQAAENPIASSPTNDSDKAMAPEKSADAKPAAVVPPTATPKTETHDGRTPENEPFTTRSTDTDQPAIDPFQKEIDPNIMIPSAFTPNGDGVNDKWKVIAPDCSKIEVVITSTSSGSIAYRSSNLNEGWDGRLPNGNVAEEGSYVYVVLLTDREGHSLKPKQGVLNLYR